MTRSWWTRLRRALTTPQTMAVILVRYDWPESSWNPYGGGDPPTAEAVAGVVKRGRGTTAMQNRLMRRYWWQLWALVDAREAELPALYETVKRHEWGPCTVREWRPAGEGMEGLVNSEVTVDDIAQLILDPRCTEATRLMLLRGWGIRLRQALLVLDHLSGGAT